jgi:hypothetical protein
MGHAGSLAVTAILDRDGFNPLLDLPPGLSPLPAKNIGNAFRAKGFFSLALVRFARQLRNHDGRAC